MKGKGKKGKDCDADECPIQFLDFKPIDHVRQCPRFTTVIQRSEDESIGFDDLDALQLELETLLVSVVTRQRLLHSEMEALVNWYDHKNKDKKSPHKSHLEITGKRSKQSDEKPNKKFKDNTTLGTGKSHSARLHKVKNNSAKFLEVEFAEPQHKAISKKVPIKNDIPNQFWTFIEPYCSEITSDDIKFVTDLMKSYDNDSEYYKVPNLGKHYSLKWENEGLDLKKQSSQHSSGDKKKGLSASNCVSSSSVAHSTNKSKKGAKNFPDSDKASFGALTQRLVSCLIEENILTGSIVDQKSADNDANNSKGNNGSTDAKIFKSLNLGNTAQLERRIRKELEEHGILNMEDILSVSETTANEDEILHELKRCQSELKALTAKNQTQLKCLITLAKKEVSKQEIGKKLQIADSEVVEAYRRITLAKQKKRSPTKKEKDHAFKAIKEREVLLKQLESLS